MKSYRDIHGQDIYYETDEEYTPYGLTYLEGLGDDVAAMLYEKAEEEGEAPFADENGYRFAIIYANGEYLLDSKN